MDDINASAVESVLNYSYKMYNLGISDDTPIYRIAELDSLIKSKPKIVVWGISYNCFTNYFNYPELEMRIGFVTDKVKLDPYSRQLFNSTVLSLIEEDYLHLLAYKRQLLVPGLQLALANQLHRWHINNVMYLGEAGPYTFPFKEYGFPKLIICNITREQFAKNPVPEVDRADITSKKRAFRYMVKRMTESGIHVIIINMPLNPNYSPWISNETRMNYLDILNSVRGPHYDLEALCTPIEFVDSGHQNSLGKRNTTNKIAEILRVEIQNASQQH